MKLRIGVVKSRLREDILFKVGYPTIPKEIVP